MFYVPYIWQEMGVCIGVTWVITFGGGEGKLTMGITNFNLWSTEVGKMEKIRLNHSLIYNDLPQEAQRICSASLPL
jgi:hypothetical protein